MLKFLLPSRRPVDNMLAGWDRPQEDEFALCNMGLPSPYLTASYFQTVLRNTRNIWTSKDCRPRTLIAGNPNCFGFSNA